MAIEQEPAYLGDGQRAFPAATVARWPERNREPMTVTLFTAEQVAAEVAAERERWAARVEEAFREGFCAPATYNDTVLNSADEAWEDAKRGLLRPNFNSTAPSR